jgi:riboflavin transport system permease protein
MRRSLGGSTLRSSLLALLVAVSAGVVLLVIGSDTPGQALMAFFVRPFANPYYLGNMMSSLSYLLIAALGVVVAFRGGFYNLGGEGQIMAGAVVGTVVALAIPDAPALVGKLVVVISGAAVGAVMAGLCGVFRHVWKTPEIITTFLLSAAALQVADYLISGPLDDPERNIMATREIAQRFWLNRLLAPSELSTSIVVALLLALAVAGLLFYTVRGYELRVTGRNERFAEYVGISLAPTTIGSMALSGALHGTTGALIVMGTHHAAAGGLSAGIGWNAIAVALIARLHPLGAIPAAAVFSYLEAGAKASMLHTRFTFELGTIVQGVIFLLVTVSYLGRRGLLARIVARIGGRRRVAGGVHPRGRRPGETQP